MGSDLFQDIGSQAPREASGDVAATATAPEEEPLLAGLEESRRVLVTGATGFVGRHLVERLLSRGHRVQALSRTPPDGPHAPALAWRAGDVTRPESLEGAAERCDVVVHLVGISDESGGASFDAVHVDGTRHLLDEAERAGVGRVVYVSAVGARPDGAPFFRTKHRAEGVVRAAGPEHVIFRPSVIYGPDDHFTAALTSLLRGLPVFPLLGVGSLRLQPVSIEDVSDALCQAVERRDVADRTFELVGPERLKFAKIVRIVARELGLRRPVVQVPRSTARPILWLVERLGLPAPLTPQQLEMFREAALLRRRDNPLRTVFRLEPLPFGEAVADYL